MKKSLLFVLSMISVSLSVNILMAAEEKENYKPEIVINALLTRNDTIGAQPGNFVIHYGVDWIGEKSPSDIEVDNQGNIYIFDMGNDRIQKFDDKGKYIESIPVKNCHEQNFNDYKNPLPHYKREFEIDKDGNFYILDSGSKEIIKLNDTGRELEKYDISPIEKTNPKLFQDRIKYMRIDSAGIPFFEETYFDEKAKEIKTKEIVRINKGKIETQGIEKAKLQKGTNVLTRKGSRYEVNRSSGKEINIKRIEGLKTTSEIKLKVKNEIWGYDILGQDKNKNIFLSISSRENGIFKFDTGGVLLSSISDVRDYWFEKGKRVTPFRQNIKESMFIDNNGNFYISRFLLNENKFQVIRWSKVLK